MTEELNIYAYLKNSHYQSNSYKKFLPKWLKQKYDQLNNNQFNYQKFSKITLIDEYVTSYKKNKALIEKIYHDRGKL